MSNKKALRKELELILVKTIEGVLNTRNVEASKSIKKITYGSSKTIAKKFYKSVRATTEKKSIPSKKVVKKPASKKKKA